MAGQSVGFVLWGGMSGWRRRARFINTVDSTPQESVTIYSLASLKPSLITQLCLDVVCMAYNTLKVLTDGGT